MLNNTTATHISLVHTHALHILTHGPHMCPLLCPQPTHIQPSPTHPTTAAVSAATAVRLPPQHTKQPPSTMHALLLLLLHIHHPSSLLTHPPLTPNGQFVSSQSAQCLPDLDQALECCQPHAALIPVTGSQLNLQHTQTTTTTTGQQRSELSVASCASAHHQQVAIRQHLTRHVLTTCPPNNIQHTQQQSNARAPPECVLLLASCPHPVPHTAAAASAARGAPPGPR